MHPSQETAHDRTTNIHYWEYNISRDVAAGAQFSLQLQSAHFNFSGALCLFYECTGTKSFLLILSTFIGFSFLSLKSIKTDFFSKNMRLYISFYSIDHKCLSLPLLFSIMQSKHCALKCKRAHCTSNTIAKHCRVCLFAYQSLVVYFFLLFFASCLHWFILV